MSTLLVVLGREKSDFAKGTFNEGLAEVAREALAAKHDVLFTDVLSPYDPAEEIAKYKAADAVIYQYPVYWFMMPPSLKRYMDQVFAYGEFFGMNEEGYGRGGLMTGKEFLLSTTWGAPADAFGDPESFLEGATVDDVLQPMRKAHTFCGFEELPHFSSHGVIKDPQFDADKARWMAHLSAVFGHSETVTTG